MHVLDVDTSGKNLFWWRGNDDCVKIVHKSRQLYDILYKQFDLNMENVIYMIDCNFIQEAPDKVYKLTNHASPFNFVQEAPDKVYTQYR